MDCSNAAGFYYSHRCRIAIPQSTCKISLPSHFLFHQTKETLAVFFALIVKELLLSLHCFSFPHFRRAFMGENLLCTLCFNTYSYSLIWECVWKGKDVLQFPTSHFTPFQSFLLSNYTRVLLHSLHLKPFLSYESLFFSLSFTNCNEIRDAT